MKTYDEFVVELQSADLATLRRPIERAVMLSMSLTGQFKCLDGSDFYTHDDYDMAMAALNELVVRVKRLAAALESSKSLESNRLAEKEGFEPSIRSKSLPQRDGIHREARRHG